jgi:hypothetical protein
LGGGDIVWRHSPVGCEVMVDSAATIDATTEFLSLLTDDYTHPDRLRTNWDNVLSLMDDGEIGVCLPFSDTVAELNAKFRDREELAYAPLRFMDASYVAQRLYSYQHVPVHVFTAHVFAVPSSEASTQRRARRFLDWFLGDGIQRRFMEEVLQSPLLDQFALDDVPKDAVAPLRSASVAEEYPFLPVLSPFRTDLTQHQETVLEAISELVTRPGLDRPSVEASLKKAAVALRQCSIEDTQL